jgi:DNA-binding transcriptional regulator YiaG
MWLEVGGMLAEAAEIGARRAQAALRRRRAPGETGRVRRPGADTPMWNALMAEIRDALRPHGAKVRLARYLGVPKQRVHDFLQGRSRLPDAELTLRLLHWLAEQRAGRDPAL